MDTFRQFAARENGLWLFLIVSSVLVFAYHIAHDPAINPDALSYLGAAEAFLQGGLNDALGVYGWPFYSILIALFSKLTTLDLRLSAYVINGAFALLMNVAFVKAVVTLGGHGRVLWWAVVVVVFAPEINDFNAYIVRDHGFWAFAVLALQRVLQYSDTQKYRDCLCYLACLLVACLFRVEGIILLLLGPLCIVFMTHWPLARRCSALCLSMMLIFGVAMLGYAAYAMTDIAVGDLRIVGEVARVKAMLLGWQEHFNQGVKQLSEAFLGQYWKGHAQGAAITVLVALGVYTLLDTTHMIAVMGLVVGLYKKLPVSWGNKRYALLWHFLILLAYLLAFVLYFRWLSARYVVLASVLLLLLLPFAWEFLWARVRGAGRVLFFLMLSAYVMDGVLSSKNEKRHVYDMVQRLPEMGVSDSLATNVPHALYATNGLLKPSYQYFHSANALLQFMIKTEQKPQWLVVYFARRDDALKAWFDVLPNYRVHYAFEGENKNPAVVYQRVEDP